MQIGIKKNEANIKYANRYRGLRWNVSAKNPENGRTTSTDTVYIDNMGTYSTAGSNAEITYHLNEGTLTGGPTVIDPFESTILPTEDQIKREGWFFAGWYDNPEFTGNPVTKTDASWDSTVHLYGKWDK